MIEIIDKHLCCGCSACVQRCPKHCIHLIEDDEGFLYPTVDKEKCIECNLCEKVCPIIHKNDIKRPLNVYAVENNNEQQRLNSSSGGVFIALAEKIIEEEGVVFACRYDNNWEVYHCKAEKKNELIPFMRSKYLQSRIENTYNEAEAILKKGKIVLFVGTPCQIAGLKTFLRKSYNNLITIDFICHGVPSPGVWRLYLREVVKKTSLKNPIITDVNFRAKKDFGWKRFGFVVNGTNLQDNCDNLNLVYNIAIENPYMKGFLANIYLRPSCYKCPAKEGGSGSDLTIADYWCIDEILPEYKDDDSGISLVIVNTPIGHTLLNKLNLNKISAPFEKTIRNNQSYYKSPNEPVRRKKFFQYLNKYQSFEFALKKYYKKSFKQKVKQFIKLNLK